jgi:tetratricopeptide (TPR) repeat protein
MNAKEKVLIHKGMDKVKRMQNEEALEIFDNVLSMNNKIPEAWNNKGVALFQLGRIDESLECYDRSLTIDPMNMEAKRNKGFALVSLDRLQEALECYDSMLKSGGDALDMESKATVLLGLGRLQEALDCMMEAVKIMPISRFEEEIEVLISMIQQEKDS